MVFKKKKKKADWPILETRDIRNKGEKEGCLMSVCLGRVRVKGKERQKGLAFTQTVFQGLII